MPPLFNKLYSFYRGAKSQNKEIMEAIIDKDVTKTPPMGIVAESGQLKETEQAAPLFPHRKTAPSGN